MKHRRDLVLGVIFKSEAEARLEHLELQIDKTHLNDMNKKQKENVSLDSCFRAFSREELLTGAD